jgi:hypothetical protein
MEESECPCMGMHEPVEDVQEIGPVGAKIEYSLIAEIRDKGELEATAVEPEFFADLIGIAPEGCVVFATAPQCGMAEEMNMNHFVRHRFNQAGHAAMEFRMDCDDNVLFVDIVTPTEMVLVFADYKSHFLGVGQVPLIEGLAFIEHRVRGAQDRRGEAHRTISYQ